MSFLFLTNSQYTPDQVSLDGQRDHEEFTVIMLARTFTFLAPLAIVFAALSAKSAPIDLFISTDYGIDQSTGMKGPILENPSGKAELVFFERGIELHFEDSKSVKRAVRVHLDFEGLLDAPEQTRALSTQIYDNIQLNGPRVMGTLLRQVSEAAAAQKQNLVVMLDARRNPGFIKMDYDLGSVRLLISNGENVRFQNMVAQTFMPEQTNSAEKAAANGESEKPTDKPARESEGLKKPLNGGKPTFVSNQPKADLGPQPLVSCELRFTPTW